MSLQPRTFRITVASHEVSRFLDACASVEWSAFDTGERVMTEEGPDAEAVLLVEPMARATTKAAALVVS